MNQLCDAPPNTAQQQRREQEDLREVLRLPAGLAVLVRHLRALGAGGALACTEEAVAMRNVAELLLHDIAAADSGAYLRIMAALRGVPPTL